MVRLSLAIAEYRPVMLIQICFSTKSVYKHPSLGSNISPSQQAESGYFPENSHRVNVYDHWVALELFKVWEYLQEVHLDFYRESISINVDDTYYVIDTSSLQTAVACVEESIIEDPKKGSNLGAEIAFTTYVATLEEFWITFCFLINLLQKRTVVSIKFQLDSERKLHIIVTGALQKFNITDLVILCCCLMLKIMISGSHR